MQFPYSIISLFCLLFVTVSCFYHWYIARRILFAFLKKQMTAELFQTVKRILLTMWVWVMKRDSVLFLLFWQKMAVICSFFSKIWLTYFEQNSGWNSDHILSGILGLQINRKISHPTNSRITRKLDSIKSISIYIAASYFWAKLKLLNCDVLQWWDIFLSNIF